jgi:hypothetical protein
MPTSFSHELNPVKGWGSPYALDIAVRVKALEDLTKYVSGSCVQLDSTITSAAARQITLGLGTCGTQNAPMPIFLLEGAGDYDVVNKADGNVYFGGIGTGGVVPAYPNTAVNGAPTGLVAAGAYELETTEFNTNTTFKCNDLLTAGTSDGKLDVVAATGAKVICGVVSAPSRTNDFSLSVLKFWPVFLPRFS